MAVEEPAREFLRHFYDILNLNEVLPVVAEVVDVEATFNFRGKIMTKLDIISKGHIGLVIEGFCMF